jgi:hypothetical protein
MTPDQLRTLFLAGGLLSLGCGGGVAPSEPAASGPGLDLMAMTVADRFAAPDQERGGRRFSIVPRNAPVAGKTTLEWIPEFWRYLFSLPASQNPELVDSADCGVGQSGPGRRGRWLARHARAGHPPDRPAARARSPTTTEREAALAPSAASLTRGE